MAQMRSVSRAMGIGLALLMVIFAVSGDWVDPAPAVAATRVASNPSSLQVVVKDLPKRVSRCLWNLGDGPTVAGGLIIRLGCDILGGLNGSSAYYLFRRRGALRKSGARHSLGMSLQHRGGA